MRCICGSDAVIRISGKTHCLDCYNAGMRFGAKNHERIEKIDDDLRRIREEVEKQNAGVEEYR